jgi:hypothetical protein
MGSSTSQPREGHERPRHLPKVGTPAEEAWARQTRLRLLFGSSRVRIAVMIIVALAVIGLVILWV